MTTIYLIRHAEAEGNLYRRAHGWYNSTITDRGYRQIAALAKRFTDTKFDAVYSSDRFRTMITALSIYKTHGLPLRTVRALREIDVGYWEDTPWAELERIDPEQLANFSNDSQKWHVDGCESFAEVRERMRKALTEIAEAHPNETVAVFSHGMAMRIIVGTLQGMTLHEIDRTGHAENTDVAKLEYKNGSFNVVFRDDASHLGDDIATIRKQPWVNDPKGFEGGIYYRSSGESGHFDVMHGGDVIGAVSVVSCRGGANSGSRRTRRSATSAKSSSVRHSLTRARMAAPSSRPAASLRAIWSASTARKSGASTPSARMRKASLLRGILNTMRNPAGRDCRKLSNDEEKEDRKGFSAGLEGRDGRARLVLL